jgi:hypothetical protein
MRSEEGKYMRAASNSIRVVHLSLQCNLYVDAIASSRFVMLL